MGNDALIINSAAYNSRHNFDFKQGVANGNVITQSYSYAPHGLQSDFHMHLSPSNLIDSVVLDQDRFDAGWRGQLGTVPHGLTTTQTVFWNLRGEAYMPHHSSIINSEQYGWGYIIGTQGPAHDVAIGTDRRTVLGPQGPYERVIVNDRTLPVDYQEGIGQGESLVPQSLYLDQLARRKQRQGIIHCPELDFRPPVPRINIHNLKMNDVVRGQFSVELTVRPPSRDTRLTRAVLMLNDRVLYEGTQPPNVVPINTRELSDGRHEFKIEARLNNGSSATDSVSFIVSNTWRLDDPFDPPLQNTWVGTLSRQRTIDQSDGWQYDNAAPKDFGGDSSRLVLASDTEQFLTWEARSLIRYVVTAYAQTDDVKDRFRMEILHGDQWERLDFDVKVTEIKDSAWQKIELSGQVSEEIFSEQFRVTMTPAGGAIQLGEVRLIGLNR